MAAVGALVFRVAGNHHGRQPLPDAAGSTIAWLVDPTQQFTLQEVAAKPADAWQTSDGSAALRANYGEALWVRVTLRNRGPHALRGVLQDREYYTDRVEVWVQRLDASAAEWSRVVMGENLWASARPWWAVTPAFAVEVPANSARVIYLREQDHYYPESSWQWWPQQEDYFSAQWREVLAKSVFLGALAALLLYNVVLWMRLRFPDMGCYVGYAAATTIFNFAENGGLALVGGLIAPPWKIVIEVVSLSVSGMFVIQFARLFLATASARPRTDRWLRRMIFAWAGLLGLTPAMPWLRFEFYLLAAVFGTVVTHAVLLSVAVASWRRGVRPARFFVAAFGVLFVGGTSAMTVWLSGISSAGPALWLLAVSTLEMLLLSFAVADRFAQTQRKLVEETEQRRVIQEAYADELKIEVHERTRELVQANADKDRMLAIIGHDLRAPLTGLMRSADDTESEFARETARTGRELLLLIEDVVLWARLRAGTRVVAVHPARTLVAPAVSLHHALAEQGGVALEVDVSEVLRVETDLVLAQTLVRNLLANALKFARTRVVLRATSAANGDVRFSVGNDGPPLPPEVAARFAAGENEPMTATGGLGLRLCREICRALGTQLEAGSREESGTEFSFTLKTSTPTGVRTA